MRYQTFFKNIIQLNVSLAVLLLIIVNSAIAQKSGLAVLSGEHVVPEEIQTPAAGHFKLYIIGDTLEVKGEFENLKDSYESAGIFYGPKGEPGNRLFRLSVTLNSERTGGSAKREDNKFGISSSIKQLLEKGEMYIAISSKAHSHGELRGQIIFNN